MQCERNADVLKLIVNYFNEIGSTITRFGNDDAVFGKDRIYQNAIALCVQ